MVHLSFPFSSSFPFDAVVSAPTSIGLRRSWQTTAPRGREDCFFLGALSPKPITVILGSSWRRADRGEIGGALDPFPVRGRVGAHFRTNRFSTDIEGVGRAMSERRRGFTLIELLVVIGIISVL